MNVIMEDLKVLNTPQENDEPTAEDLKKMAEESEKQEEENLEKAKQAAAKFEPQIPIARTLIVNGVLGDARSAQIRYQQASQQLSIARQVKRAKDDGNKPEGPNGEELTVTLSHLKELELEVSAAINELKSLAQVHHHFSIS